MLDQTTIKIQNQYLNKLIQKFVFYIVTKDNSYIIQFFQKKNKSGIIIIDQYINTQSNSNLDDYFIICFDYTSILIPISDISLLFPFFSINEESVIYCLSEEIKLKLQQLRNMNNSKFRFNFSEGNNRLFIEREIPSFLTRFIPDYGKYNPTIRKIFYDYWTIIRFCVSGFLIKIAYQNSNYDRIIHYEELFSNKRNLEEEMKEDRFIELMPLDHGSSSSIYLVYLIEKEEICLLKFFLTGEEDKLFERERNNYNNIHHPLLPRYFGTAIYKSHKCLLIEYLVGKPLSYVSEMNLSINDKIKIIFEIIIIIEYLHYNNYIYRDLKPNNIIIDKNKTAILIDFDRMIQNNQKDTLKSDEFTDNFEIQFFAPEIIERKRFTNKSDIYSLGKVIQFIISGETSVKLSILQDICNDCLNLDEDKRPTISLMSSFFFDIYFDEEGIENIFDDDSHDSSLFPLLFLFVEYQNKFVHMKLASFFKHGIDICKDDDGNIHYHKGNDEDVDEEEVLFKHIPKNLINSFCFYHLAADNYNNPKAQYNIGLIHLIGVDIDRAIYYLSLAADQNYVKAQHKLGKIYYKGKYITEDIDTAIYYLTLAAQQNYLKSIFELATIYYDGMNPPRDIEKAIYYFKLGAEQNNVASQFALGEIYYHGKHCAIDIEKAIYYFSLASNNNHDISQFNLGYIYYEGEYVQRDIKKSIHYYSLAADHNNVEAQYNLGLLYFNGNFVEKNINKAIHYFSLAANQNNVESIFFLGNIYSKSDSIYQNVNKAIYYYSLAADLNHSESQFILATIYIEGEIIQRDINKAIHYYSMAAKQDNCHALYHLGVIYSSNKYDQRDIHKAIHYLTLAANLDYPNAQNTLGNIYFDEEKPIKNIDKAFYYYKLAANHNFRDSLFNLGLLYSDGEYVDRDIKKAIHYYLLAANQNSVQAQYNLGVIYYKGIDVERNTDKAIHYLTLAANQNFREAQYILGIIYGEDEYVPRDINKSLYYFTLSANQNYHRAQFRLGLTYYRNEIIPRDIDKAFHYFSKAAEQGNAESQFFLGLIYSEGKYVERDMNKAIRYLLKASNQNFLPAHFNLGYIYSDGKYVPRDIDKAIHYYTLAANGNDTRAQINLAIIYEEGKNVPKNMERAFSLYKLAADQNNPDAQYILAVMYYEGDYLPRNIEKSLYYYHLAANQNDRNALYNLGIIYEEGKFVQKDVSKAIHYYTLAANKNQPKAQFYLGLIYFKGRIVQRDIKKGIYLITLSSMNGFILAHFFVGFFRHEGKYVKCDINKAIHHYKETSSFNNQYAKNNLGIIFKNGFENQIKRNLGLAIEYFKEAIRQKNDKIAMYNLAHLYLYENIRDDGIDESIQLLINSALQTFSHSIFLLCLALIKKFNGDMISIKNKVDESTFNDSELSNNVCQMIIKYELNNDITFERFFECYRKIDFLYDLELESFISHELADRKLNPDDNKISKIPKINELFYEGFGFDI
ncbi:hypothetical protein M9Y10_018367 [Tritrichomonas musculus]|uniref:Protein kinase domain-containing protein n=1 Tax=Tritrichomonas musculus TaxID=1915356 RepID=A0ABR2HNZ9_9EUKA